MEECLIARRESVTFDMFHNDEGMLIASRWGEQPILIS
jgi:hypothetical protein